MKSDSNESPNPSSAELNSGEQDSELHDFLYVDRSRVSALYAQLSQQGTLATIKTTDQASSTSDTGITGSIPQFFRAESKGSHFSSEGIERMFDATWAVPLEVLRQLSTSGLMKDRLDESAHIGLLVRLTGYLRLIDYAGLRDIWEPAMNLAASTQPEEAMQPGIRDAISIVRGLPPTVHAHFLTRGGYIWLSLDAANLLIPAADLTLKYGGGICGAWRMVCILDALPTIDDQPHLDWQAGEAALGVLQLMHAIRTQIGRPSRWFGATPIVIYRPASRSLDV